MRLAYESLPMDIPTFTVGVVLNSDIMDWIEEHDGDGRIWIGTFHLYFELEEDASFFALRWAK